MATSFAGICTRVLGYARCEPNRVARARCRRACWTCKGVPLAPPPPPLNASEGGRRRLCGRLSEERERIRKGGSHSEKRRNLASCKTTVYKKIAAHLFSSTWWCDLKSLCGGGVPSSHPSLGLSVFFLSFFGGAMGSLPRGESARCPLKHQVQRKEWAEKIVHVQQQQSETKRSETKCPQHAPGQRLSRCRPMAIGAPSAERVRVHCRLKPTSNDGPPACEMDGDGPTVLLVDVHVGRRDVLQRSYFLSHRPLQIGTCYFGAHSGS